MHSQARSYSKQHRQRLAAQTTTADEYHSHSMKKLVSKEAALGSSKLSSQIKQLQEKHKLIDVQLQELRAQASNQQNRQEEMDLQNRSTGTRRSHLSRQTAGGSSQWQTEAREIARNRIRVSTKDGGSAYAGKKSKAAFKVTSPPSKSDRFSNATAGKSSTTKLERQKQNRQFGSLLNSQASAKAQVSAANYGLLSSNYGSMKAPKTAASMKSHYRVTSDPDQYYVISQPFRHDATPEQNDFDQNSDEQTRHAASVFHPQSETEINQQLLDLQTRGQYPFIAVQSDSSLQETAMEDEQANPIFTGAQLGGSGAQNQYSTQNQTAPVRHFDSAQPYQNFQSKKSKRASSENRFRQVEKTEDDQWQAQVTHRNGEGGGAVRNLESGILNMHRHLKTLEGKYIDLANYYKSELMHQQDGSALKTERAPQTSAKRLKFSSAKRHSKPSTIKEKSNPGQDQRGLTKGSHKTKSGFLVGLQRKTDSFLSPRGVEASQEKAIIKDVKAQKKVLESEMKNLLGLYSEICDEKDQGPTLQFQSRIDHQRFEGPLEDVLGQILSRFQSQLLLHQEYNDETFEENVEKTFYELYEELTEFCSSSIARQSNPPKALSQKLPTLSIMDRIEKLAGDYEIQQEYSLSNLKETIFQIQHSNDQFQLDMKKLSLDFGQVHKRVQDLGRNRSNRASEETKPLSDELISGLDQLSRGVKQLGKRLRNNDDNLKALAESHRESVRYLRQYHDNFKSIVNDFNSQKVMATNQSNPINLMSDMSADNQGSVNQSGHWGQTNLKQQAEITQLNQEIFSLRAQLADSKQSDLLDLNDLKEKLETLSRENTSLNEVITHLNQQMLDQAAQLEAKEAETVQQRSIEADPQNVHIAQGQIFEEYWRQSCQQLIDKCDKFLHSLNKLHEVVVRKESNVQSERQNYDLTKKELKLYLKEVKRNLENQLPTEPTPTSPDAANQDQQQRIGVSATTLVNSSQPNSIQYAQIQNAPDLQQPSITERTLSKQQTDSSQIPHKMQTVEANLQYERQMQISELKTVNVEINQKLAKEKQEVQKLKTDLKTSQEKVKKLKLSHVPRETFSELEQSMKQLQEVVHCHETRDSEQRSKIKELQSFIRNKSKDPRSPIREQNQEEEPDYSTVLQKVSQSISSIVAQQADQMEQVDQHLQAKEVQICAIQRALRSVSSLLSSKDEYISRLLAQSDTMNALVEGRKVAVKKEQDRLKKEIYQLQSQLQLKAIGNKIKAALMRGFKQKLETETTGSKTIIQEQAQQVMKLTAKVETSEFKRAQSKQILAKSEKKLQELQSKMGNSRQDAVVNQKELAKVQEENDQLKSTLHIKQNGNVILNALMRAFRDKLRESESLSNAEQEAALQAKAQFESQVSALQKETQASDNQNQKITSQLHEQSEELEAAKAQLLDLLQTNQQLNQEIDSEKESHLKTKSSLRSEVALLQQQLDMAKKEHEQAQKDLRNDRDAAQAQLADFVNQNKFEKESLEGKLQHQLNQTLAQLNAKEDESELLQKKVEQLNTDLAQQASQIQEQEQELTTLNEAITVKNEEVHRALAQVDAYSAEIERLNHEKSQDTAEKQDQFDQMLAIRDNVRHCIMLVTQNGQDSAALPLTDENEIDLDSDFEELENLLIELKASHESQLSEIQAQKAKIESEHADYKKDMEHQVAALTAQLTEALANAKNNDASDSGMQDSIQTLQKENMQLLQRLQKTERQLQNVRSGTDDSQDEIKQQQQQPKEVEVRLSPDVVAKLEQFDSKMERFKRDLFSAKQICLEDLQNRFAEKLKAAQRTFVDTELLRQAVTTEKVSGWNNIVRECKSVKFDEKQFLVVQDVTEQAFYLVDQAKISETAIRYLKEFIADYEDQEFVLDVLAEDANSLEESPEIRQIKELIQELRSDRNELQAEVEQFRSGAKTDTSRLVHLKEEEMKEDIEYLTGENKDLHSKVKEVCLTKANLQIQLARARKQLQDRVTHAGEPSEDNLLDRIDASEIQNSKKNVSREDIAARATGGEGDLKQVLVQKDDDFSDHDSVLDVVNQLEEEDNQFNSQEMQGQPGYAALNLKLNRAQTECHELRKQLSQAESQLEQVQAQKEESDEDNGASMLPHIKQVLIEFLKNVPLTDGKNESVLNAVFSFLDFTREEIDELNVCRGALKVGKGKPARGSSIPASSLPGNSTNSLSRGEDDGSGKQKQSRLFGILKRGKKDVNSSSKNQSDGATPNLKPLPRK